MKREGARRPTCRMIVRNTNCIVVAITLCALAASRGDAAQVPPPELDDTMWQALPQHFVEVFVEPGGRLWWLSRLWDPWWPDRIEQLKMIIAEQFHNPSPVISGARPILFEPGGRVWFQAREGLIGYDGARWIIRDRAEGWEGRPAPNEPRFLGNPPNHGRSEWSGSACIAGGTAFFPDTLGVHCFDLAAETWSYQMISKRRCDRAVLLPEPDGRGVVAFYDPCPSRPPWNVAGGNPVAAWRWRGGKWTQIPLPDNLARHVVAGVAASTDGIWLNVDDYLRLARSRKGQKCERYMKFIAYDGLQFEDPQPEDDPLFNPAPYSAKGIYLDFYDGGGIVWFKAKEVFREGRPLGPGMIVRHAGGVGVMLDERFAERPSLTVGGPESGPLLVPGGKMAWTSSDRHGRPAKLFDLETGSPIATICDEQFRWLITVAHDGTLFAATAQPAKWPYESIAAQRHEAPDERIILDGEKFPIDWNWDVTAGLASIASIGGDGSIWTCMKDKTVEKFNGERWQAVAGFPRENFQFYAPGHNGEMLASDSVSWYFYTGKGFFKESSLGEMVTRHPAEIAEAYALTNVGRYPKTRFAVDRGGNVWMTARRKNRSAIDVWMGKEWVDISDRLPEQMLGGRRMLEFSVIGDGGIVYICDKRRGGTACYCELVDGELVLIPAPKVTKEAFGKLQVKDKAGGLWVPVGGNDACRLSGAFEEEKVIGAGCPVLADESGNVWLRPMRRKNPNRFNIWSNGRIASTILVPSIIREYGLDAFFSDRPGSAWAFSPMALYHFTAVDPLKPAHYSLAGTYFCTGIKGYVWFVGYSKLGFVVLRSSEIEGDGTRTYLHIVKLPEPEEQ